MAVIKVLEGLRSWNVVLVMVDASIASLKIAETAVLRVVPVAPLAGVTDVIVGGIISAVVNFHVKLLAKAFPATSFTPEEPPLIVAVYKVELANAADGVNVAVLVAAL